MGSIENLNTKLNQIFRNVWFHRFLLLTPIYIAIFLAYFKISITTEGAQSLITTLIQSQASILAIVITLSLVAVQLAASSYSARVLDIFKESPTLWIITGVYIFSIFYELIVLGLINTSTNINIIENQIIIIYFISIFAFGILVPYMVYILDLMNPSTVINKLAEDITLEKVSLASEDNSNNKDPIQPIMDVVHSSLIKYDYGTLRECFKIIDNKLDEILMDKSLKKEKIEDILNFTISHYERSAILALNQNDDDSTREIINKLTLRGKTDKLMLSDNITKKAIDSVFNIGNLASRKGQEDISLWVSDSLFDFAKYSIEHNLESSKFSSAFFLAALGKYLAEQRIDGITSYIVLYLGNIHNKMILNQDKNSFEVSESLNEIGKLAIRNKLDETGENITHQLTQVITDRISSGLNFQTELNDLFNFAKESAKNKFEVGSKTAILDFIGLVKELSDNEILYFFSRILEIGEISIQNNLEATLSTVYLVINEIIDNSTRKNSKMKIDFILMRLRDFGVTSLENDMDLSNLLLSFNRLIRNLSDKNIEIPYSTLIIVICNILNKIENENCSGDMELLYLLKKIVEMSEKDKIEVNTFKLFKCLKKGIKKDIKANRLYLAKIKLLVLESMDIENFETLKSQIKESIDIFNTQLQNLE